MKNLTQYQVAKALLTDFAKEIKAQYPSDKPLCKMEINDYAHYLCNDFKQLKNYKSREVRMFEERLHNVACKLHPKD